MSLNHPPALPVDLGPTPMHRALALAQQGLWLTSPNPRVGCVITAPDGQILGEGHTQRAGGPHAEIMALRDAAARGHAVQGATAWVTLEPCAHQGRTGPCCDALAAAGVGRVVSAMTDPNPQVAGQGMARLAAKAMTAPICGSAPRAYLPAACAHQVLALPRISTPVTARAQGTHHSRPFGRFSMATATASFTPSRAT